MSGRCDGSNTLTPLSETVCVKQTLIVLYCKEGRMLVHASHLPDTPCIIWLLCLSLALWVLLWELLNTLFLNNCSLFPVFFYYYLFIYLFRYIAVGIWVIYNIRSDIKCVLILRMQQRQYVNTGMSVIVSVYLSVTSNLFCLQHDFCYISQQGIFVC